MKSGYTISFRKDEHKLALYHIKKRRVYIEGIDTAPTKALRELSKTITHAVVCFSPSTILQILAFSLA